MSKISELKGKIKKLEAMVEEKPMLQESLTEAKEQRAELEKEEKPEVKEPKKKEEKKVEVKKPTEKKKEEPKKEDEKVKTPIEKAVTKGFMSLDKKRYTVTEAPPKEMSDAQRTYNAIPTAEGKHDVSIHNNTADLLRMSKRLVKNESTKEKELVKKARKTKDKAKKEEYAKKAQEIAKIRHGNAEALNDIDDLMTLLVTEIDLVTTGNDATSLKKLAKELGETIENAYKNDDKNKLVNRPNAQKLLKRQVKRGYIKKEVAAKFVTVK